MSSGDHKDHIRTGSTEENANILEKMNLPPPEVLREAEKRRGQDRDLKRVNSELSQLSFGEPEGEIFSSLDRLSVDFSVDKRGRAP